MPKVNRIHTFIEMMNCQLLISTTALQYVESELMRHLLSSKEELWTKE